MADRKSVRARIPHATLPKCPSGIRGLDDITGGGFPRGRPSLVAGAAGSGKTLLSMEFLVRGALEHGEPGVFMAFEENARELAQNVVSLGFDLADLVARKKILVDYVSCRTDRNRGDGGVRPRGPVHPPWTRHRHDRGEARRARHDRVALRGIFERGDPAIGASAPVPVVKGKGGHRRHHGGARGEHDHTPRPGRVRGRLRDPSRSPGHGPDLDEAPAGRQVPRLSGTRRMSSPSSSETKGSSSSPSRRRVLTAMSPRCASPRGFPASTRCSGGKGITAGAPSWSPGRRERERRAWRRRFRTLPAVAGSDASTSPWRRAGSRFSGTCVPSGST